MALARFWCIFIRPGALVNLFSPCEKSMGALVNLFGPCENIRPHLVFLRPWYFLPPPQNQWVHFIFYVTSWPALHGAAQRYSSAHIAATAAVYSAAPGIFAALQLALPLPTQLLNVQQFINYWRGRLSGLPAHIDFLLRRTRPRIGAARSAVQGRPIASWQLAIIFCQHDHLSPTPALHKKKCD